MFIIGEKRERIVVNMRKGFSIKQFFSSMFVKQDTVSSTLKRGRTIFFNTHTHTLNLASFFHITKKSQN